MKKEAFCKTQPRIKLPDSIDIPKPEVRRLGNGVDLYTIDTGGQEVVRVSFVFRAGTSLQDVPFCASATANLLSEGSSLHSAHEIAERLDYYGSYFDVSLDRDYAVITFVSLSKYFEETMQTASELLFMPVFPEDEIRTYCAKRKQYLEVERSKVSYQVRELFIKSLYGESHPYGVSYPENYYDRLTRGDITAFYGKRFTAGNCFTIASGTIGDRETRLLEKLIMEMPSGGDTSEITISAPVSEKRVFGSHPGAVQSGIRVGRILFPRMHPDYIPMQVVTAILGGYFGSRLVRNLREERGYTYGVFAGMANLQQSGYMAVATEVSADATADSIHQIFAEMDRLRTEPVGEEELQMVRNIMTGEIMRILDGPFGIADVTIENIQNGTSNDYLDGFLETVRKISPETVLETARKYLDPADFTVTVVGDDRFAEF